MKQRGRARGDDPPGERDPDPLATPNCQNCLHPMEPAGSLSGSVHWRCRHCGRVRIA